MNPQSNIQTQTANQGNCENVTRTQENAFRSSHSEFNVPLQKETPKQHRKDEKPQKRKHKRKGVPTRVMYRREFNLLVDYPTASCNPERDKDISKIRIIAVHITPEIQDYLGCRDTHCKSSCTLTQLYKETNKCKNLHVQNPKGYLWQIRNKETISPDQPNREKHHQRSLLYSLFGDSSVGDASCISNVPTQQKLIHWKKRVVNKTMDEKVVSNIGDDTQHGVSKEMGMLKEITNEEDIQAYVAETDMFPENVGYVVVSTPVTSNPPLRFKCDLCERVFSQRYRLTAHMRGRHSSDRPFQCPQCPATFKATFHLQRHARRHTGVRPYRCSICGSAFTQPHHLQLHALGHTGMRPFSCGACGKSYTRPTSLYRHRRGLKHKETEAILNAQQNKLAIPEEATSSLTTEVTSYVKPE